MELDANTLNRAKNVLFGIYLIGFHKWRVQWSNSLTRHRILINSETVELYDKWIIQNFPSSIYCSSKFNATNEYINLASLLDLLQYPE